MRGILSLLLALLPLCAHAATLYCGPSSAGSGTGADLTNRMALPNTTGFVRGNVYVIIEGSYGSKTLSTATSGTTTITIEYLTSAHSAVAGYSSSLHDGQATFGTINPTTRYWIVDGKTRTESNTWTAPTGYGFAAAEVTANSLNGDDADFSQFRYIDIGEAYAVSPSSGTINGYGVPIYLVYNQSDITFTRCAVHNGKGTLVQGAGAHNLTFEYCHFGPGWGKEAIRGGNGSASAGWIIRHNRFWNSSQTDPNDGTSGITAEIGIWDAASGFDNFQVYGNWFFNQHTGGRNSVIVIGGDGGGWAGGGGSNNVVYNNLFHITGSSVFTMIDLNGSSNVARNNAFYNCTDTDVGATTTSDNDVIGSDIFTNSASHDYRPTEATSPGYSLSSPHDTDPNGVTRGGDGTWDVGAFEFTSGGGGGTYAPTRNAGAVLQLLF